MEISADLIIKNLKAVIAEQAQQIAMQGALIELLQQNQNNTNS